MTIDDLNLGFEEDEDRGGRHTRRAVRARRRDPSEKPNWGRSLLAMFMTLVLFGLLGLGGYAVYSWFNGQFSTQDYSGQGIEETVQVEVKSGATQAEIGTVLADADVVKSPKAFVEAGEANRDARKIQPGFYKLRKQMSGQAAVLALLDPATRLVNGVLIQEGLISLEIYKKLAEGLGLKYEAFVEAAKDPVALGVPDWWFNRTDGKTGPKSLEGFLFPATYEFPPGVTEEGALKIMVNKFLDVTTKLKFSDRLQAERGLSPYEGLIAASIVESELQKPDDMLKGARALYNRLYTDVMGHHRLQLDAAINYNFKINGDPAKDPNDFLRSEIENPANPYNTHLNEGWPITPISNPGENALKAALDAPPGNWLFWVTVDQAGTTLFADTWAGHCANIQIAVSNGVLSGNKC